MGIERYKVEGHISTKTKNDLKVLENTGKVTKKDLDVLIDGLAMFEDCSVNQGVEYCKVVFSKDLPEDLDEFLTSVNTYIHHLYQYHRDCAVNSIALNTKHFKVVEANTYLQLINNGGDLGGDSEGSLVDQFTNLEKALP